MSLIYTPVTQSILCLIFLMYIKTTQRLNYVGQESNKKTKSFADYDSDTAATLKQGQGHQTWNELVDPKQGYDNAKFKKPLLNSANEKAKYKVFCQIRKQVNHLP